MLPLSQHYRGTNISEINKGVPDVRTLRYIQPFGYHKVIFRY
jgi:hypothetical protein